MQSAFLLGNLSPNLNSANILAACLLKNVVLATGLKSPEVSRVSAMVGRSISISLQQLKVVAMLASLTSSTWIELFPGDRLVPCQRELWCFF